MPGALCQTEMAKPDSERELGQIFLKSFDFFIVYSTYITKHVRSIFCWEYVVDRLLICESALLSTSLVVMQAESLARVEQLCQDAQFEAFILVRLFC